MSSVPLVHITDLYHPPQDPDDHVDLATVFGLPELDLRAIILDQTRRALRGELNEEGHTLDPGFVPVEQLNHLAGRKVPVAAGPMDALGNPRDTAEDRPLSEQRGIELLLHTLRESKERVCISVVSSLRILAAAFNRDPELLHRKVDRVLLNAGSSGNYLEWNVELDPAAYACVLRSGLPIDWYPCANGTGPFETNEHNTYWKAPQVTLFRDLQPPLRAWFYYAFSHGRCADVIRVLQEEVDEPAWQYILSQTRNLWSTASLVIAAGRSLVNTSHGWRFVPAGGSHTPVSSGPWSFEEVAVTVDDHGITRWKKSTVPTGIRLFRRETGPSHDAAMLEALNALLRDIKTV